MRGCFPANGINSRLVRKNGGRVAAGMTPEQFIAKWGASRLPERGGAQSHFNDLCELLEVPKPAEADAKGADYAFEKSLTKPGGRRGRADVWKRGCFAFHL